MAGFRRIVNRNFPEDEDTASQYEDSQDPSQYENTPNDSPSLFAQHRTRTSSPVSRFQLPPRFPMSPVSLGVHTFRTPMIVPRAIHIHQPSFFEMQYPSQGRASAKLNGVSRTGYSASSQNSQKVRNQWTKEQTDAMMNAWRESFVELESHNNPAA